MFSLVCIVLVGTELWKYLNKFPNLKIVRLHMKTQICIFSRQAGWSGPGSLRAIVSYTQLPLCICSSLPTVSCSWSTLLICVPMTAHRIWDTRTQALWTSFPQTWYPSSRNFSRGWSLCPPPRLPLSSETLHESKSLSQNGTLRKPSSLRRVSPALSTGE